MTTPLSLQQAAAGAMAIEAARAAGPDPVAMTSLMSEQLAQARERAAAFAKRAIRALWIGVDPYSDKEVAQFAKQAAGLMAPAQSAVARAAGAAQGQQLFAQGIHVTPVPSDPLNVRASGVNVRGGKVSLQHRSSTVDYANDDTATIRPADMTTEAVFRRPAVTFRYIESVGGDDPANRASLRIDTIVDDNLMLAERFAQTEALVQAVDLDAKTPGGIGPKIIGYRRVIHPELSRTGVCGLCIAAADRVYYVGTLLPIHKRCKCTIAAVTDEHDPADDLNQADLRQLYTDAGGTSAAHLKRTRYQVDEHGELGPSLIPAKPYKPRPKKKPAAAAVVPKSTPESRAAANVKLSALLDSIDLTGGTD